MRKHDMYGFVNSVMDFRADAADFSKFAQRDFYMVYKVIYKIYHLNKLCIKNNMKICDNRKYYFMFN